MAAIIDFLTRPIQTVTNEMKTKKKIGRLVETKRNNTTTLSAERRFVVMKIVIFEYQIRQEHRALKILSENEPTTSQNEPKT